MGEGDREGEVGGVSKGRGTGVERWSAVAAAPGVVGSDGKEEEELAP